MTEIMFCLELPKRWLEWHSQGRNKLITSNSTEKAVVSVCSRRLFCIDWCPLGARWLSVVWSREVCTSQRLRIYYFYRNSNQVHIHVQYCHGWSTECMNLSREVKFLSNSYCNPWIHSPETLSPTTCCNSGVIHGLSTDLHAILSCSCGPYLIYMCHWNSYPQIQNNGSNPWTIMDTPAWNPTPYYTL